MMAPLAIHLFTATLVGVPPQQGEHPQAEFEAISFANAGCFQVDVSEYPLVTFYATEPQVLLPYGESTQQWEITAIMGETDITFVSGWFEFAFEDDDGELSTLHGEYLDFDLDLTTSDYTVDWHFAGGTGEFEDVVGGVGQTHGQADLITSCAEYSFNGLLLFHA